MTPEQFMQRIMLPSIVAFPFHDSPQSRVLLLAIAGQESFWADRLQEGGGSARGFWQWEQGTAASRGGITGLVMHPVSAPILKQFCQDWELEFNIAAIYEAIAWCDPLAYACARLLLWLDPAPLPITGNKDSSYEYYLRNWRPGKPRPETWPARYAAATTVTTASAPVAPPSTPVA